MRADDEMPAPQSGVSPEQLAGSPRRGRSSAGSASVNPSGGVIAIVGATASGKSSVADKLAKRLGSCVVSADAMQVYRGMDIGTAKTPVHERGVPLELVDVADVGEDYSAALYQRDARAAIDRWLAAGKTPVVCGGTGLYVRAALDKMDFPKGDKAASTRSQYQDLAEKIGAEGIHDLLARRDPAAAALIHPNNVRRTVRALEMLDEGKSYAVQHEGFSTPIPHYRTLYIGLNRERAELYRRIDKRVDRMMDDGLLAEIEHLAALGLAPTLTAHQAIGYKELIDYLGGRIALADAVALIKQRSRHYAKRQLTWFRRDKRIVWLDMDALTDDEAVERILELFSRMEE